MRILGAKFSDRSTALHALEHLRSRFGSEELAVAPLADGDAHATLLAGLFEDRTRDEARHMLVSHGGQIVTDLDELRTH